MFVSQRARKGDKSKLSDLYLFCFLHHRIEQFVGKKVNLSIFIRIGFGDRPMPLNLDSVSLFHVGNSIRSLELCYV